MQLYTVVCSVPVLIRSLSADCGIWAVDTRTRRTIKKRGSTCQAEFHDFKTQELKQFVMCSVCCVVAGVNYVVYTEWIKVYILFVPTSVWLKEASERFGDLAFLDSLVVTDR